MREIKFRAWLREWSDDGGKMFNKCLPMGGWDKWWIVLDDSHGSYDGEFTVGKDCDIMQFTGLRDKNGKEIYEGDVLRGDYHDWLVEPIDFYDWGYGYAVQNLHLNKLYPLDTSMLKTTVFGNIYENPELFRKKNEPL